MMIRATRSRRLENTVGFGAGDNRVPCFHNTRFECTRSNRQLTQHCIPGKLILIHNVNRDALLHRIDIPNGRNQYSTPDSAYQKHEHQISMQHPTRLFKNTNTKPSYRAYQNHKKHTTPDIQNHEHHTSSTYSKTKSSLQKGSPLDRNRVFVLPTLSTSKYTSQYGSDAPTPRPSIILSSNFR
jgi:hypothetical protein